MTGLPPSNASCILSTWLVNLGYTLELVPLVVKVGAINRLLMAARRMRRVTVQRKALLGTVAMISSILTIYLIVWTILDPPRETNEYLLTEETTDNGEIIVGKTYYCTSHSKAWSFAAISWVLLLLLCATVLAFQVRHLRKEMNETSTLGIMIYSHCMFVALRFITVILQGQVHGWLLGRLQSFIYAADTIVTIIIYFYSKIFAKIFGISPCEASEFNGLGSSLAAGFPNNQDAREMSREASESMINPNHGRKQHVTFKESRDGPDEQRVLKSIPDSGRQAAAGMRGCEVAERPALQSLACVCITCGAACPHCQSSEREPLFGKDEGGVLVLEEHSTPHDDSNEDLAAVSNEQDRPLDDDANSKGSEHHDEEVANLEQELMNRLSLGGKVQGHGRPSFVQVQ